MSEHLRMTIAYEEPDEQGWIGICDRSKRRATASWLDKACPGARW